MKTDALNVIVGLCILSIVCIQISGEYIVRGASFQHNYMILGNKQKPNGMNYQKTDDIGNGFYNTKVV
jgi:hypothetical protein